ncbi:MAG: type II toxin-antitoxin system HicB family antitoxin [Nitrosomonas sp.]|nr:type II toxin-antitoxin system HicB family antitoxin [Nitrosomonas sp.]
MLILRKEAEQDLKDAYEWYESQQKNLGVTFISEIDAAINRIEGNPTMKAAFTAIIEAAPESSYWAICPEVPGANGQGETIDEAKNNLKEAIELILEDRREDMMRGLSADAIREKIFIE